MTGKAKRIKRLVPALAVAATVALGIVIHVPQALAFPYRTQVGEITVHAETPIDPLIASLIRHAEARLAASEIATPLGRRDLFLTDGGLRWRLLSIPNSGGAFALTRPLSNAIVVNRSSVADDWVDNGGPARRTLSGTIAHESTHLAVRRHFGLMQSAGFDVLAVEGYCDHVAGESTLRSEQAEALRRQGSRHPALAYFDARQRVEARLARGQSLKATLRGE